MTEAERIEPSKWRKKYNDLETKMRIDKEAKKFADDCPHYSYEAEKGYRAGATAENERLQQQLKELEIALVTRDGNLTSKLLMKQNKELSKMIPELTPSELERLALLTEECAEVQQVIMKIIRHGYGSYNPFDESKTPNRELLNKELGDLQFAIKLMIDCHDINPAQIARRSHEKEDSIKQYLHHNTV